MTATTSTTEKGLYETLLEAGESVEGKEAMAVVVVFDDGTIQCVYFTHQQYQETYIGRAYNYAEAVLNSGAKDAIVLGADIEAVA